MSNSLYVNPLTVLILTHNEESNLPSSLESLKGLDCDVFIVDSESSDRTKDIALAYGAYVFDHPFETHAKQWKWALENLPISTEWILGLDADQKITPELRLEINEKLKRPSELDGIDGFYIKRRQVFRGKWIRYGGYYPKYLLKLFRREKVRLDETDLLDHHFYVNGVTARLSGDLVEHNKKEDDIAFWIQKHNRYAQLLAWEELLRRNGKLWPIEPRLFGSPDQRTAWLKNIWIRTPLYIRPFIYFTYRYFLRLGFLDGKEGFIFHFLQGFWFRMMVDIYMDELK